MAAAIIGKRHLGPWIVGGGLACSVLLAAVIIVWIWLPRWAPEWVMAHSPWTWPALRAGAVMVKHGTSFNTVGEVLRHWTAAELPVLIQALDHDEVRLSAIRAMGKIDDPRAFHHLVTAMTSHSDAEVRRNAALGLGDAHRATAGAVLVLGLRDTDPDVRWCALRALKDVRSPDSIPGLVEFLDRCLPDERADAVDAMATIIDPRIRGLLVGLLKDSYKRVRIAAAYALVRHPGPGVVAGLEPLLSDPEKFVRGSAVDVLLQINEPESSRALAAYLTRTADAPGDDAVSRTELVRRLATRKDHYANEAIFSALTDRQDPVVKAAAWAYAVHRAEDLPRLDPLLTSHDERVRLIGLRLCYQWKATSRPSDPASGRPLEAAMPSMAEVPPATHLALLIELLSDSALEVRRLAIQILAEYRDPRSVDPLIQVLSSTADEHLRRSTRRLLLHGLMLTPEQRSAVDRVP